ncbi:MAG TPA: hypothetical protein VFI42_08125, partial [Thermomicrobiaceae bacterium]|nr:hypothetical protein [Thermomicrobiaceae bacterium]
MDRTSATAPEDRQREDPRARLRASLRLIFDDRLADQLAALAGASEDSMRRMARLAERQYRLGQLRRLVQRRAPATPPLAPRLGLGARAALALALHLGLDLNLPALAEVFQATP